MRDKAQKPFYLFLSGRDYKKAAIAWADECLETVDSPNLALLASAKNDSDEELKAYFLASLKDVGFKIPGSEQEPYWLEKYLCQEIMAARIDELTALRELYQLSLNSNHHQDFDTWLYLDDSIDLLHMGERPLSPFEGLNAANVKEIIRQEAKRILTKYQDTMWKI